MNKINTVKLILTALTLLTICSSQVAADSEGSAFGHRNSQKNGPTLPFSVTNNGDHAIVEVAPHDSRFPEADPGNPNDNGNITVKVAKDGNVIGERVALPYAFRVPLTPGVIARIDIIGTDNTGGRTRITVIENDSQADFLESIDCTLTTPEEIDDIDTLIMTVGNGITPTRTQNNITFAFTSTDQNGNSEEDEIRTEVNLDINGSNLVGMLSVLDRAIAVTGSFTQDGNSITALTLTNEVQNTTLSCS